MLTFFRRIRRSIIDSGDTRKYLFYAIGEILLVMIGILLALQVSNWNEHKKQIEKTNAYRSNLIVELQSDLSQLDINNSAAKNHRKSIWTYIDYYNGKDIDVLILARKMDSIQYEHPKFISKSHTIEEIISVGNLSWFGDKEKNAMLSLRSTHTETEDYYTQNTSDLLNYANTVNEHIDVLHLYGYSIKEHPDVAKWKYDLKSKQMRLFNNEVAAALYFLEMQAAAMQIIRKQTEYLIDILTANLNTN